MRSVRTISDCSAPVRLFGDDLFSAAGLDLPHQRSAASGQVPCLMRRHEDPRSGWTVLTRFEPTASTFPAHEDEGRQFFLSLSDRGDLKHLVSPRCLSFMNAAILGVVRHSKKERSAAARLQRQGVLYFGDLTFMSFSELMARLGSLGRQADTIADAMAQMGLAFNSSPSWWVRPPSFYERAF